MKTQVNKVKIMILAGLAAVTLMAAGIIYYLSSPSSMIAIDVNPSIEIHTNRLGDVVSIDPINEDAVQLMAGYQLADRDLESVIRDIVDRMVLNGYLVNENTDQILVSADKNRDSASLLGEVTASLNTYLQEKKLSVTVLNQKVDMDKEEIKTAHKNEVSVGKMALINALVQNGSSLTPGQLAHASIKALIQYALKENISLQQLIDNYNSLSAQGANPTAGVSPAAGISPTAAPVISLTPAPVPDQNSVTATPEPLATIIITTRKNNIKNEDADEEDIEDANKADEGREDANEARDDREDSGRKSNKETADTGTSGVDGVSGATVNTNKDSNSSSDFEDEDNNDDNDSQGDDYDFEDGGQSYHNGSGHDTEKQDYENEDNNSQGDEGEDD